MGWFWSSAATPAPTQTRTESASKTATLPPAPQPTEQPESDYGDPEIAKFMSQIRAEFGGDSSSSNVANTLESSRPAAEPLRSPPPSQSLPKPSSSTSSWSSLWKSSSSQQSAAPTPEPSPSRQANTSEDKALSAPPITAATSQQQQPQDGRLDPLSESLLPTTMSCRQAFDQAFYCQSLGGQWNAVYRQGEMRSCGALWEDYWFCMRTRAYSGKMKEEAIRGHYRKRELEKYGPGRPNSTDVWEARSEAVPEGSAFREPLVMPDVSDEEWRLAQIERRRSVQAAMEAKERGGVAGE